MFAMAFHGPETKYINSICDERIGPFKVDKVGTLSGPIDHNLINWLTGEGFIAE